MSKYFKQILLLFLVLIVWFVVLTNYNETIDARQPGTFGKLSQAFMKEKTLTLFDNHEVKWPPKVGEPYPDLILKDSAGKKVRLSDFKGKVLLIEPIGMTCAACNAFAGGHEKGGFGNIAPQPELPSLEEIFPRYAMGAAIRDTRIVIIHLLLYDLKNQATTPLDAKEWKRHFDLQASNELILSGHKSLINNTTFNMIPGFQLVDKKFVLRVDGAGNSAPHNIWTQLFPMIPKLLSENL